MTNNSNDVVNLDGGWPSKAKIGEAASKAKTAVKEAASKAGKAVKEATGQAVKKASEKLTNSSSLFRKITGAPDMVSLKDIDSRVATVTNLDDIENNDSEIKTLRCQIIVNCEVAKQIRDKLHERINEANTSYNTAADCSKVISEPVKSLNVKTNPENIKAYVDAVKKAQTQYSKKLEEKILFDGDGLDCVVLIKNGVHGPGVIGPGPDKAKLTNTGSHRVKGHIKALKPKERILIVDFIAFKQVKDKDLTKDPNKDPIQVTIKGKEVNISNMCIGDTNIGIEGEENVKNVVKCTFGQSGGGKGINDFAASDSGSPDNGICE